MATLKQLLEIGTTKLQEYHIEDAKTDAWILFEDCLQLDRMYYFMHMTEEVKKEQETAYLSAIEKRCSHYPTQYITGKQMFMGLEFTVNEHVLIPRQDTEVLVETILKECPKGDRVLDMCTGSGCIAISLDKLGRYNQVFGSDISSKALLVAQQNNQNLKGKVIFIESDLFQNIKGTFDFIVSNPPYIRPQIIETLEATVKDYEPRLALDGGEDGLDFYRIIIENARDYLNEEGYLFFEIGYDQGAQVSDLLVANGFCKVTVIKDLAGLDRVVYGQKLEMN